MSLPLSGFLCHCFCCAQRRKSHLPYFCEDENALSLPLRALFFMFCVHRVNSVDLLFRFVIAGGGAPEIQVALRLAEFAQTLTGMEAYCMRAFAEALEVSISFSQMLDFFYKYSHQGHPIHSCRERWIEPYCHRDGIACPTHGWRGDCWHQRSQGITSILHPCRDCAQFLT